MAVASRASCRFCFFLLARETGYTVRYGTVRRELAAVRVTSFIVPRRGAATPRLFTFETQRLGRFGTTMYHDSTFHGFWVRYTDPLFKNIQ